MNSLIYPVFYTAIACFVAAAAAIPFYVNGVRRALDVSLGAAAAGALGLTAVYLTRTGIHDQPPMTTGADNLSLFIVLSTLVAFIVMRHAPRRGLACFYMPAIALLALCNAYAGWDDLARAPEEFTKPYTIVVLFVHVSLAFLAYALFFVSSLTSLAYIFQAQRLKQRKTMGLFQSLPSLENLDDTLVRHVRVGYFLFVVTLFLGWFLSWYDRELLGPRWFLAPKIILSLVMVVFFAVNYHARSRGWLRGPKLAYLVFGGFGTLLGLYVVLAVLRLRDYNFFVGGG